MATDNSPCDVWIVCALAKEAQAVTQVISEQCKVKFTLDYAQQNNRREYQWTVIQNRNGEPLHVRVSCAPDKGPQEIALHLQDLLREMPSRFVGMTGICAGDRNSTSLGDIVVGEKAFLYDTGKYVSDSDGRQYHKHNADTWRPNLDTLQYTRNFLDWEPLVAALPRPSSRRQQRDWLIDWLLQNPGLSLNDISDKELYENAPGAALIVPKSPKIFTDDYKLTPSTQKTNRRFSPAYTDQKSCKLHIAPIASGSAVRADNPFEDVQVPVRDTIAIEMEGATFYRVVSGSFSGIHSLLVKAVCDYADPEKDDSYHDYAAEASALYMLSFIQKYVNNELMSRPRTIDNEEPIIQAPPLPKIPDDPPFFTGRSELLKDVRTKLQSPELPKPIAITGLGGEGKTCFVTRFCHEYSGTYTKIFWVQAQTETTLREDYAKIASHLQLPEAKETDQELAVSAVKRWLASNSNWLMVLDNADDLPLACSFLPIRYAGHVLITTQPHATGIYARTVRLPSLSPEDAALLLLRCAKLVGTGAPLNSAQLEHRDAALQIVAATDGLPLALDQAGAYIEQREITPARYLEEFQTRAADLMKKRGEMSDPIHKSVAVTFSLAFDRVEEANFDAADLLRCAAYLAPTNIPESIFTNGLAEFRPLWSHAADPNLWDEIVLEACRYSLLTHSTDNNTLNIHRLVQIVLRDAMTPEEHDMWTHQAIAAVSHAFPPFEYEHWSECDQFLPHAQECAKSVLKHNFISPEAGSLLLQLASYLHVRAQYEQALPEYLTAREILTSSLGLEHPDTLGSLNNLANLYLNQGRYNEAEPLYLQVKEIRERALGKEHPDTLSSLNNLAILYADQGRYEEAVQLYEGVVPAFERKLGSRHPWTKMAVRGYVYALNQLGRNAEADALEAKFAG